MNAMMKDGKKGMSMMRVRVLEEGRQWKLPGHLSADDLALCGESEEDMKVMVGCFVNLCRKTRLKVNISKSKVMMLNGEECGIRVDGM